MKNLWFNIKNKFNYFLKLLKVFSFVVLLILVLLKNQLILNLKINE